MSIVSNIVNRYRRINREGIGFSKKHNLLEYKSDLNDPEYWNSVLKDTGSTLAVRAPYTAGSGSHTGIAIKEIFSGTQPNLDVESLEVRDVLGRNVFGQETKRINIVGEASRLRNPLGSPGISLEKEDDQCYGFEDSKHPARVFDSENSRYVKDSSIIPSWIEEAEDNPSRNKSEAYVQRDLETVRVMSDWSGDEPNKTYLSDNSTHYEFATRFEREQVPTIKKRAVGNRVPTVSGFTVATCLPRDEIATLFYQKYLKENGYPGGQEVKDLEYNKAYEEALGLIPFCITTITPDHRTYLNFQANLDSYDDSYTGEWDSVQYIGRAEKFWGYTGFSRDINISFKVLVARKEDCAEMYHRLNRLVGATAPSYDSNGLFMRGTLASLTIGDLLRNKAGIIKSVKITWQQDYPWEVRESKRSNIPAGQFMVPHVLDVSLQFTPIEEKTVTEDNGDYFVFRQTPLPTIGVDVLDPVREKQIEPSTGLQIDVKAQQDNTYVSYNPISRNGNIRGGSSGLIGMKIEDFTATEESKRIEEAILGKINGQ